MADEDNRLDKVLTHLDSIHTMCDAFKTRLDSMEAEHKKDRADSAEWKARADAAEKERADKVRKDAEEKEEKEKADAKARADAEAKEKEEKEKADKARADAEEKEKADAAARAASGNTDLARRLAEVERYVVPGNLSDADKAPFAEAQMRFDSAYQAWNLGQAPRYLNGETLNDYRVRLASKIKQHSKIYKDSNLGLLVADSAAFSVIENAIINDAVEASCSNITLGAPLRMQESRNESGHIVRKFVGDAAVTWAPFMGGATKFGKINRSVGR